MIRNVYWYGPAGDNCPAVRHLCLPIGKKTGKTLRHINPSIHDIQENDKDGGGFDGHRRY